MNKKLSDIVREVNLVGVKNTITDKVDKAKPYIKIAEAKAKTTVHDVAVKVAEKTEK